LQYLEVWFLGVFMSAFKYVELAGYSSTWPSDIWWRYFTAQMGLDTLLSVYYFISVFAYSHHQREEAKRLLREAGRGMPQGRSFWDPMQPNFIVLFFLWWKYVLKY
jgi:hypothetical protein